MVICAMRKIDRVREIVSVKVGVVGRGGWRHILVVKEGLTCKMTFDQCHDLKVCVPAKIPMLKSQSSR